MEELLEIKQKRKREKATHRWSETQTLLLLEAVAEAIKDSPERFEKPTSQKFYGNIMEKEPALEAISWQCAKNKMRNLRSTYVSAETWRNNTGSGLMERGDEASVRAHILKMSPYYDILGTIYGHRQSVAPSFIIETNDIAIIPSDPDDEEVIEDVEVLPVNHSETNEFFIFVNKE